MKTETGIVHSCTKIGPRVKIEVKIRLDDECNNKHCEFAITCSGYHKAKNGVWVNDFGGCCHDKILKYFPQFEDFVRLHLCDCHGAPMYALENGLYWLKEGGAEKLAEYWRITPEEAQQFVGLENDKVYAGYLLVKSGIVARWQAEADAAIKHLEELTGDQFVNPYPEAEERRQFHFTSDDMTRVEPLVKAGYYAPEAITKRNADRVAAERAKKRQEIVDRFDKEIAKAQEEKQIMLFVFDYFGTTENVIYYSHKKEVVFNWSDWSKRHYSRPEFTRFVDAYKRDDISSRNIVNFTLK